MQDRIVDILDGNFDYEIGALDFSCSKLELSVQKDTITSGSFEIFSSEQVITSGYVYASHCRMRLDTDNFTGAHAVIGYTFDSHGMPDGETIKGEIAVISGSGEYYLPFVVNIVHVTLESSLGNIKNLFHFTNLAKSDWNEALRLFYSKEFASIFNGNDKQFYQLYLGLSHSIGNSRNMEEFLLAINKKQRIEYLVDDEEIKLEDPQGSTEYGLRVTRNGWGYSFLEASCENDTIAFGQSVFVESNFVENKCSIWFKIKTEKLHPGNNYDAIVLKDGQASLRIPVIISVEADRQVRNKTIAYKRMVLHLMSYYKAFRLKKISLSTWTKETTKIIDEMISYDEENVNARLFQAQVLISAESDNEARWILDYAQKMLDPSKPGYQVSYAYYLYLSTLVTRDMYYTKDVTETVSRLYSETGDWRIAWLLLYLSEDFSRSDSKKWLLLEEQFKQGCTSPIVYIEALRLIHNNPTLLKNAKGFELQICNFAAKNDCLSKDMVMQLTSLASKEREFSPVLYRILALAYSKKPDNDILTAICSLLIRGNKTDGKYFHWYEAGANAGIRLTKLYEYYMSSIDLEKKTPLEKVVLMYFSYQSNLNFLYNAYLYADVLRQRDKYPEIFAQYSPQIENFVVEQIKKGRINKDLATLYKYFLSERMLDEETVHSLSTLLFMNQISTDNTNMTKVIIRHPQLKNEAVYSIVDGKAMFPLWSTDYVILFEDISGNRYAAGINYTMEKLMIPGKVIKLIGNMGRNELGLNMYLCDFDREYIQIDEANRERFEMLNKDDRLLPEYRHAMGRNLARFYFDHDLTDALDWFLSDVDPTDYNASARNEFIEMMILRGMTDKAYDWVCRFGTTGVDTKSIVKLVDTRIEKYGDDPVPELIHLCAYVFGKGKYDELILNYLIKNFEGLTKDLRDIWKATKEFGLDTYFIAEKIIMQMLFAGSYVGEKMEIFKDYVEGGAKTEIELAFISQCAYDYFVNDRLMPAYAFEDMQRIIERGQKLHRVCKLALIKYYAEHKDEIGKAQQDILSDFITELLLEGIRLSCFSEFKEFLPLAAKMDDSAVIEYHTSYGAKAVIHYILEKGGEDDNEYREEEMDAVYGGVFHKEIPIFFGERVQYYITESVNGRSQLTESATLQKNDIEKSPEGTRYDLVNDIAIAQTLKDYDTVDDMVRDYKKTEFMTQRLFNIR